MDSTRQHFKVNIFDILQQMIHILEVKLVCFPNVQSTTLVQIVVSQQLQKYTATYSQTGNHDLMTECQFWESAYDSRLLRKNTPIKNLSVQTVVNVSKIVVILSSFMGFYCIHPLSLLSHIS